MIGGDIVVAFFDKDQKTFKAVDYYMSKYSQVCIKFYHFPSIFQFPTLFSVTAPRACVQTSESGAETTRWSCPENNATA